MRELVYLASVEADFVRSFGRIAINSGSLAPAEQFISKLRERCAHLARLPGTLGRQRTELLPGLRNIPHKRDVIFFRYSDQNFVVVNILEAARDLNAYFSDDD